MADAKGAGDGIVNTSGALIGAYAPVYLAMVPVTSWLSSPDGVVERLIKAVVDLVPGGTVPSNRVIPALAAVYVFWTFGASGSFSSAGQAMSRSEGLERHQPRVFIHGLRGLPQRLMSAHANLMENFPGFAVAAALAQVLAPSNAHIVNLLGFHVLAKLVVYYPAYVLDVPPPRSLAHILATSAIINVCWKLALGAK